MVSLLLAPATNTISSLSLFFLGQNNQFVTESPVVSNKKGTTLGKYVT
jgi:hypothetical protein